MHDKVNNIREKVTHITSLNENVYAHLLIKIVILTIENRLHLDW